MMKDYLTYTMMGQFGAAAPLCSFVYLTVNGEDWGLYLAVEGIEDSFLQRNYGSDYGELYKPDSMSFGGGRGNGKDFSMDDFMNAEGEQSDGTARPERGAMPGGMPAGEEFDPSAMFGGQMPAQFDDAASGQTGERPSFGGGFGGMGSSDVKLQYIDDDPASYSNIWNNAKTQVSDADQERLIGSLKLLSEGKEIETVVDVERVLRYFVVHNFVCNGDSYTGAMIHNYYLYEDQGMLSMIPWDYNLGFGTFQGGNAQSTVNTPIDSPVSGGTGEDRPMWYWIVADEAYTELYHQYFGEFLDTVDPVAIIDAAAALIAPYVQQDPTAFYSYDAFQKGVDTLRQFCALRSESVAMQLCEGQTVETADYVDASSLALSDMGSMGMGGGFNMPAGGDFVQAEGMEPTAFGFDSSQVPEGFDPSQMGEEFDASQMPEGFDPGSFGGGNQMPGETGRENAEGSFASPGDRFREADTQSSNGWIWIVASALALVVGLIVVKKSKY